MNKSLLKLSIIGLIIVSSYFVVLLLDTSDNSNPGKQSAINTISITRPEQISKIIPWHIFTDYHRWAAFDPITPSLINRFYSRYAFHVASSKPLGRLIRSAIARNLYPSIPKPVIFRYLKSGQYNANGIIAKSTLPYLNFSLFGYHSRRPLQNNRVLHVAKILIANGANVNGVDVSSGRNPLHEAILMNHHEVVKFLLRHKANPQMKVNQPKSKFHGMNSLQFAIFMEEAARGENYSEIIKTLTLHLLK